MAAVTRRKRADDLAHGLHAAAIHLLRRVRREDERSGIGPARLSALSVLVFGGAMRLTELARAEHVKPPTMTRIVAALEQDGFVRRLPDDADARAIRVEATRGGIALMHEARRRRVQQLADGIARLSTAEQATVADATAIIERLAATI
jgi:DNA-binding MarR family transcriptional regulator